jgi:ankyrin repeat protein
LLVLNALSEAGNNTYAGKTALWIAAKKGYLDCVKFFLAIGWKVDKTDDDRQRDDTGETALMKASAKGHLEIVKILHEAGANLNFTINPDWVMP